MSRPGGLAAEPPRLSVSVRDLVAFAARHGDLLPGHTPAPTASQGQEVHRLIAQRREEGYEAEVWLSGRHQELQVQGRADLLDPTHWRLEEVKSHYGPADAIPAFKRSLDWAQLQLYGALLCQQHGLESVELALVYVQVGSLQESPDIRRCAAAELHARFEAWCERYLRWARHELVHRRQRDQALATLRFAHPSIRPAQMALMQGVARAIEAQTVLLAEGPTGVGKTLGVLFPALRRMPKDGLDKLVYATAKTTGRHEALKGLERLTAPGVAGTQPVPLRVLELAAQDKVCLQPPASDTRVCHGAVCPHAQGFYDKLPSARLDAVHRRWLDQGTLRQVGLDHGLCPYFLAQELVRWADVIVTDYHQVFSDHALVTPMVAEGGWRVAVLVDEAHNLVDRAQAMFSAELACADVAVARQHAPRALHAALDAWAQEWQGLIAATARAAGDQRARWSQIRHRGDLPASWMPELQRLNTRLGEHFAEDPRRAQGPLLRFWFKCLRFVALIEDCDAHALIELDTRAGSWASAQAELGHVAPEDQAAQAALFTGTTPDADGEPGPVRPDAGLLRLVHHVPAARLQPVWARYTSWVVFSATLPPTAYFQDMLALPPDGRRLEVPSPFRAEQLRVLIEPVSTRYRDRAATIGDIVERLLGQVRQAPGNYLAFFSSFDYLALAAQRLRAQAPGLRCWCQQPGMTEAQKQDYLACFEPGGQGLGLAVLGGVFGEGVDLPGDRLIGAFVVSVAHPRVDERLLAILGLRSQLLGPGKSRDYTLVQPGMQKVVQAAGRVIRTPEDQGTVMLFDERFTEHRYRTRLPGWWRVELGRRPGRVRSDRWPTEGEAAPV